jgi:GDPmannose 4,6-dehydratase
MKKALITGITGQDGAYLAEFLLTKGYEVHGIKRRTSMINTQRIDHIYKDPHTPDARFRLHYGDLTDSANLIRLVQQIQPDEIYNLGAMSHVRVSFEMAEYTANADGLGVLRLLEAILLLGLKDSIRFYQASSSELYGHVLETPQTETTPFYPRSPYGVAKLFAYWTTVNYREAYGLFASNGILFNHESPIRGETFVTRKITRGACRLALGLQDTIFLGNLDAKRDWGHAKDYVEAMYLILQHNKADDFVIATGITTSVRDFILKTFDHLGVELEFSGEGLYEEGRVSRVREHWVKARVGQVAIRIDPEYFRPTEVDLLIGNASKAARELKWRPRIHLNELIHDMVESDLRLFRRDAYLREGGHKMVSGYE